VGSRKITAAIFALLAGIPVIFLSVILVFNQESLFWGTLFLSRNRMLLDETGGLLFLPFSLYIYLLLGLGFLILVRFSIAKGGIELRKQIPLFISVLAPLAAHAADNILHAELVAYDLMPVVLSLSSLAVIYYTRLQYFRTIPLTQHVVIESMNDIVLILDPDNILIYANQAGDGLFREGRARLLGKPISESSARLGELTGKKGKKEFHREEIELGGRIYDAGISPITGRRKKIISRVIVLRDITRLKEAERRMREMKDELEVRVDERTAELKDANRELIDEIIERTRAEETVKAALEEKNILLGELHHRVKNNLQVISSLLNLQSHYITDKDAKEIFNISVGRIRSIAIIHEKLYKSEDLAHALFGEYIHEIAQYIISSQSRPGNPIRLSVDIAPVNLDLDRSILCGLIINELLTNAIKHAFPPDRGARENEISISFAARENAYTLTLSDNGRGIPSDSAQPGDNSLGMKIIQTLVGQLKGTLAFYRNNGTTVRITFPVERIH